MTQDDHQDEFVSPEMPLAFDDDGRPVTVTQPAVYDDEIEADSLDTSRDELAVAMVRFLVKLDSVGDSLKVGQTVKTLAFLTGQTQSKSKVELARELKVSPGRVSQILAEITREFESLSRLKSRSAKARPTCRENNFDYEHI